MEYKLEEYSWVIWGCCAGSLPPGAQWEEVRDRLIAHAKELPGYEKTSFCDIEHEVAFVLGNWSEAASLGEEWHRAAGNPGEIKITREDIEAAIKRTDKVGPGCWAMPKMNWSVWF